MKNLKVYTLFLFLIYTDKINAQSESSVTGSTENSEPSFKNLIILDEILHVFDIRNVGANWSDISKRLTNNCSQEMEDYMRGLQAGKVWAVKSK